MPRKKGNPSYEGKNGRQLLLCDPQSLDRDWARRRRRTGKSKSDIIQHCLLTTDTVDTVTRQTMQELAGGVAAPPARRSARDDRGALGHLTLSPRKGPT
jgi:hypothetical protein